MIQSFVCLLLVFNILSAQENETCLECHDDEELSIIDHGIPRSLYVTEDDLADTPHDGFDCITCHTDLEEVDEYPHPSPLHTPECGTCHDDIQEEYVEGFYEPLQQRGYLSVPYCNDCHQNHNISTEPDPRNTCGICHQAVLSDLQSSHHWDLSDSQSIVVCADCHDPHNKREREWYTETQWRVKVSETCSRCHEDVSSQYQSSGHGLSLYQGNPEAPTCANCHNSHAVTATGDHSAALSLEWFDETCLQCHAGYDQSIHRPRETDDLRLETCAACHQGHNTDTSGGSRGAVYDTALDNICLKCHGENLIVGEGDAHGAIHRDEIAKLKAGEPADCGSCHEYHFLAPNHSQIRSLQKECADCHPEQEREYESSSHYAAWSSGHEEAPTCIDCHNEKRIEKAEEQFVGQSIIDLCSRCHANRDLTMKFQLNSEVVAGYSSSYHGQMYQLGFQGEQFATCISCHDNHHILPPDNPESTISKANIIETCRQCHENANENFVTYLQHYTPNTKAENPALNWIHTAMVWLLGSVFLIFGGHTLLWFIRLSIKRIKNGPLEQKTKSPYRVRRFNRIERLLHLGMVIGFLTLSATGLPLKYSHTAAANWIVNHVIGFQAASQAHRIAAGLLIVVFFTHLFMIFYKIFVQKKKGILWGPDSLVPNKQDIIDFYEHVKWFLGLKKREPKFGRWTYWEKFDYFAVFWGMFVIGLTGLTLWFPETFTRLFPGWVINAAHIIHSEEALLATAFIFTVHFFNTHLRPGAFPMDEVIFTGRMTEERFQTERVLEREKYDEETYRKLLTKPLPVWMKRVFYVAGYTFLFLGIVLLILIIIGSLS